MTVYTWRAGALDTDGRSVPARETLALMNTGLGLQDLTAAELKDLPALPTRDAQTGRPP